MINDLPTFWLGSPAKVESGIGASAVYIYNLKNLPYTVIMSRNDITVMNKPPMSVTAQSGIDSKKPQLSIVSIISCPYSPQELNGIAGPDDVLPMHDSYEEVKAINDDVIGWITIDGTVIDYPVVRAADNDYYLGRDVEKRKSAYGAIFMDFRNADPAQQKHIILYGHNMKNGTMFHDLMNYKQKSFFDEHRIIDLLWDGVETQWEIFVAYIIKPNTIYHISTAFTDDQHFADVMNQTIEYAKTVKPSNADPDVTIKPSDQVLTLSTCTYEYDDSFFAVMARRIK